jgi:hypothetical protein
VRFSLDGRQRRPGVWWGHAISIGVCAGVLFGRKPGDGDTRGCHSPAEGVASPPLSMGKNLVLLWTDDGGAWAS